MSLLVLGTHRSLYLSWCRDNAVSLCDQDPGTHENHSCSETHVAPSVYQQPRGNQILIFTPWAQVRTTLLKKAGNSMFLNMEIRSQRGRNRACCRCSFSSAFIYLPSTRPPCLWEASHRVPKTGKVWGCEAKNKSEMVPSRDSGDNQHHVFEWRESSLGFSGPHRGDNMSLI